MRFYTALLAILLSTTGYTQPCQPDSSYFKNGLNPDSLTGIPPAYINQPYQVDITVIVPADTTVMIFGSPQDGYIDSIVLLEVDGIPGWLNFVCWPSGCGYPGGSYGCGVMSGTPPPGSEGDFPLDIITAAYGRLFSFPSQQLPPQIDTAHGYYTVRVSWPVGVQPVAENNPSAFV